MAGSGEFDFIRTRLAPLARGDATALGLTDDAAMLNPPEGDALVLATDMLVAGVHFRDEDPPEVAAWRALRSNLSDMAAMGAVPRGFLSAISWPRSCPQDWRDAFIAALGEDAGRFELPLWGGDTTATPGPLTLALTLVGAVPDGLALTRGAARAGDRVWVSGTIGDAGRGLAALQDGAPAPDAFLDRYRRPEPRLALGVALRGLATACIDISDGLVADAGHIAETSAVRLDLEADRVPLSQAAAAWLETAGEGGLAALVTAGDDYELLFTAPASADREIAAIGDRLGLLLTPLGRVREGEGVALIDSDGEPVRLEASGFTHF